MKSVALLQGKFHQMFDRFSNIMFNAQNIFITFKYVEFVVYNPRDEKKRQIILKEKSKAVHRKLEYVHFLTNE